MSAPGAGVGQHRPVIRLKAGLLALLMAAVVAFYAWTVLSTNYYVWQIDRDRQGDYYNLLADGMLDGHLYLKVDVPEALVHAEDPYDPEKRPPGSALHDVSYYRGRYYLYFGAAPVVVLFLPFTLLTGSDLPQYYGNVIFAAAGFGCATGLLLALRRRYFPGTGFGLVVGGILVLGLGSMLHGVLRRPSFWELPIASGYFFAMLALVGIYWALHARRPLAGMALAGLSLGLAVASRPTYIVAAPLLAAPLAYLWWQGRRAGTWKIWPDVRWWRPAVAGALGCGLMVIAVLWYNTARFGRPTEFGLNYQLTGLYESKVTHFTPRFAWFNAYVYYLAPAQWSRYFPFVEVIHAPAAPQGYYATEFVYGALVCLPVAWLALLAPVGLWRRDAEPRARLGAFLGGVALLYVPVAAIMLCFVTSAARYMVDFVPALMLLACCGLLALDRWVAAEWPRRLVRLGSGLLVTATVFFGLMASFQLYQVLRVNDPAGYGWLARLCDWPSQWVEQLAGTRHGPLELRLRFDPPATFPTRQVLVSTGGEFYSDHVSVTYPAPGQVQLGFEHSGERARLTPPIPLDFSREHILTVDAGSLYPPPGHPFFAGRSKLAEKMHAEWLCLTLDGQPVLQGAQAFHDGSPGRIRLGGMGVEPVYGSRFTGQILSAQRVPYAWMNDPRDGEGALRFSFLLPSEPSLRSEPLLASGSPSQGDLLYCRFERPDQIRFGYDHGGVHRAESDPIPCAPERMHDLEVRFGGLLPSGRNALEQALRESLVVKLDGKVVWARRVPYYENPGAQIVLGRNDLGASGCERGFTGAVMEVRRTGRTSMSAPDRPGAVALQLMLPRASTGRSEPLAAWGSMGKGNLLHLTYLDESHIGLGLHAPDGHARQSAPIEVDYRRVQDFQLRLFALAGANGPATEKEGVLEVWLNGAAVWRQPVPFDSSWASDLNIGENRLGSEACDAVFSGGIVELRRLDEG